MNSENGEEGKYIMYDRSKTGISDVKGKRLFRY